MFKFNWDGKSAPKIVSFFFVALLALLVTDSAVLKSDHDINEKTEANYAAYQRREDAYRECLNAPSIEKARECYATSPKLSREQERAESNLSAQQSMASSAYWMILVSVVTVVVTAIGVVFVWQTLMETRRIGEAQVRAYVHALNPEFQWGKPDSGATFGNADVFLHWTNKGQSPALELGGTLAVEFLTPEENGRPIPRFETINKDIILGASAIEPQGDKRIGKISIDAPEIKRWVSEAGTRIMVVHSAVIYKDVFGRVWRSENCSEVVQKYDSHGQHQLMFKTYPHHNRV